MATFLLCLVHFLCCSTLLVNGQCTVSTYEGSESDEDLMRSLDEHDLKLRILGEQLFSTFGNLEVNDSRTIVRCLEEHDENLVAVLKNLSQAYENGDKKLLQELEKHTQIMKDIYHNTSMKLERIGERIQTMNESMVRSFRDNELKLQTIHENFTAVIDEVNEKLNAVLNLANETIQNVMSNGEQRNDTVDYCQENITICDCSTIKLNGYTANGVYRIFVVDQQKRYYANAFCDMTTTSSGWTVFQRRKDGSEDFYRGWNDYANGFGNANNEFWLGNDFLHLMTSKKRYKLRIDMGDFAGNTRYAEYSTLNISSSTDKYRLTIGAYSGNAGDSLVHHNNHQFSTKDQDNDVLMVNCANIDRGAWWYYSCHLSNLNGIYFHGGSYTQRTGGGNGDGIVWYYWLGYSYSLKTTEMKISPY